MVKSSNLLYVKSLTLNNFATFENQTIEFSSGLNCIIGQTGSGKSLILDALSLLFGQRADRKFVRKGHDFALIQAQFETASKEINHYLDKLGHPIDGPEVILKRIIYSNGQSKSYINGILCPLNTLSSFAKRYVDLVGQFDNQKLLSPRYQLKLIDQYADNLDLVKKFEQKFQRYSEILKELESLESKQKQRSQRESFIDFQLNELNALNQCELTEDELIQKKSSFVSLQNNQTIIQSAQELLVDSESSVLQGLSNAIKKISAAGLPSELSQKLEDSKALIEETSYGLSKLLDTEIDEEELNLVIDLLDRIGKLKRKFKLEFHELFGLMTEFQAELEELKKLDLNLEKIKTTLEVIRKELQESAEELNRRRREVCTKLAKELSLEIHKLNMKGAHVQIEIKELEEINSQAGAALDILAELNPGEGLFSIKDIASGGELSRILLSLRKLLSGKDTVSVFLFDEIDTGLDVKTAIKIGEGLKGISSSGQVICITHLPQMAQFADNLIEVKKVIKKSSEQTRTFSGTSILKGKAIKEHLSGLVELH